MRASVVWSTVFGILSGSLLCWTLKDVTTWHIATSVGLLAYYVVAPLWGLYLQDIDRGDGR